MAKEIAIFSIDSEIWKGYRTTCRVVATSRDWLFFLVHKHKGKPFTHNGRLIKVLNFTKVANWERYQKLVEKRKADSKRHQDYKKKASYKDYCKAYDKKYRESHREKKAAIQRAYLKRKKEKEQLNKSLTI